MNRARRVAGVRALGIGTAQSFGIAAAYPYCVADGMTNGTTCPHDRHESRVDFDVGQPSATIRSI